MRAKPGLPAAALLAAVIAGTFSVPCAAQQPMAAPPGVTAAPITAGGAPMSSPMNPWMTGPGPTTSAATSNTSSAIGSTTITTITTMSGPRAYSPPGIGMIGATTSYSSSTSAPASSYGSSGGAAALHPAQGTLQATTGTIETGSASSAPPPGSVVPLNMAPAGVALNSDLRGTTVLATYSAPATQTMGAGPAYTTPVAQGAPQPRKSLRERADRR